MAGFQPVGASVGVANGRQMANRIADQETVMNLLSRIPSAEGGARLPEGPMPFPAPKAGFCHPILHQAILNFQRVQRATVIHVDGHVDPGGRSIARLNQLANGAATPAPAAPLRKTNTRFLIQFVGAKSVGIGIGLARSKARFGIADAANHLVAEYDFEGGSFGVGLLSAQGDGGFASREFTTPGPASIEDFAGPAIFARAGVAFSPIGLASLTFTVTGNGKRGMVAAQLPVGADLAGNLTVSHGHMRLIRVLQNAVLTR